MILDMVLGIYNAKKTNNQITDDADEIAVEVKNVTMSFNMANEQLNSLKEYFIKFMKRELFFKEFIALQDISFTVKKGDVYGIVGTNGSGKSTILKIIAGVLEPTKGTCTINGDIAPLIELGAGFDMELTARENIYLNGALLGYSRAYIDKHFNEIVDFAELWDFLDIPMKNYSSGMVARIAFAIATIIVPDILIVDETLSVGDVFFKEKCQRRINTLINDYNTTVLFVSHSIDEVESLCHRAIWIEKGHKMMEGDVKEICEAYRNMEYISYMETNSIVDFAKDRDWDYSDNLRYKDVADVFSRISYASPDYAKLSGKCNNDDKTTSMAWLDTIFRTYANIDIPAEVIDKQKEKDNIADDFTGVSDKIYQASIPVLGIHANSEHKAEIQQILVDELRSKWGWLIEADEKFLTTDAKATREKLKSVVNDPIIDEEISSNDTELEGTGNINLLDLENKIFSKIAAGESSYKVIRETHEKDKDELNNLPTEISLANKKFNLPEIKESKTNDYITRQDVCCLLYDFAKQRRIDKCYTTKAVLGRFADKDDISEYAEFAMNWCVANELMGGQKDPTGRVMAAPTGDMVAMGFAKMLTKLYRNVFAYADDVSPTCYVSASGAYDFVQQKKIMSNNSAGKFTPYAAIDLAQLMMVLMRFDNLMESDGNNVYSDKPDYFPISQSIDSTVSPETLTKKINMNHNDWFYNAIVWGIQNGLIDIDSLLDDFKEDKVEPEKALDKKTAIRIIEKYLSNALISSEKNENAQNTNVRSTEDIENVIATIINVISAEEKQYCITQQETTSQKRQAKVGNNLNTDKYLVRAELASIVHRFAA